METGTNISKIMTESFRFSPLPEPGSEMADIPARRHVA
jgi:hypothetical protein